MSKTKKVLTLPKRLRILGKPFTVEIVAQNEFTSTAVGKVRAFGGTIHLLDTLPPQEAAETLLHEVIHALDVALSTGLKERQVVAISSGLYAVLQDNPTFAQALRKDTARHV